MRNIRYEIAEDVDKEIFMIDVYDKFERKVQYFKLSRIRYLVDGPEGIRARDLGGLIVAEKAEKILPQEGNGWLKGDAKGLGGTLLNGVLEHGVLYDGVWEEKPIEGIERFDRGDHTINVHYNNCGVGKIRAECSIFEINEYKIYFKQFNCKLYKTSKEEVERWEEIMQVLIRQQIGVHGYEVNMKEKEEVLEEMGIKYR